MNDLGARGVSGRLDSGRTSRLARRLVPFQTQHPARMFARFRGDCQALSREPPIKRLRAVELQHAAGVTEAVHAPGGRILLQLGEAVMVAAR